MRLNGQDPSADRRSGFFGVIVEPQSYLNIVYLLVGLPLGTLYLTVLVTGFSVGLSMMIVALLGIPILIVLWYVIHAFARFEHGLATTVLDVDIAPLPALPPRTGGLWTQFKALMGDRPTWVAILYLFLRFPAGIATFTLAVTAISVSLGAAFAPAYMWASDEVTWGSWTFDPFLWSFALVPFGIIGVFVALHAMNLLARACGGLAQASLGGRGDPAGSGAPVAEIDLRSRESSSLSRDQAASLN